MPDTWSCLHFSLANPRDSASDLPRLLRELADEVERRDIKPMDVLDISVKHEMTEDGPWWSMTVYWSPDCRRTRRRLSRARSADRHHVGVRP